ncbi:hypothetical protein [Priestia megaterium]|uniref:hypothetical protein n=1 Tax=Priestia megaterium TaxID=1404 RepID=UPI003CC5B3D5
MIKVIETNISIDDKGMQRDHQSRVVEFEEWEDVINEFKSETSVDRKDALGTLHGKTIPLNAVVEDLKYDHFHLSCDVIKDNGRGGFIKSRKLVYLIK